MNILDSLDVGVAVIDRDGTITEWSEPAAYLIDRPRDTMVGQPFRAALPARGFDEAVERLQAKDARFDALLFDVHLDDAHSGFELFSVLVEEGSGRERHVVFTTGDSISMQTRDQLERSGRPVLRKPFSLDDLRDVLGRASQS